MSHDPFLRFLERRDRKHFTALVEAERDVVLGAAWRVVGEPALAEDVTQEVFMKVLNSDWKRDDVRSGRGFLVAQALGIARTKLRQQMRRARHEKDAAAVDSAPPTAEPEELEAAAALREAVAELPDSLGRCVELRYFGGLAAQEIASHLGVAKRTVNERLQHAREKLRTRLSHGAFTLVGTALDEGGAVSAPHASAELVRKLDRLGENLPVQLAAAGAGIGAAGFAGGLVALLLATALGLAWALQDDAPVDASKGEAVTLATPEDRETHPVPADADLQPVIAMAGVDPSRDTEARTVAVAATEDGTTSLKIKVVDASGELLRRGRLELQPADIASWNALDDFASNPLNLRWARLLDSIDLSEHNPLVLENIPEALVGPEFEAFARSEIYPPSIEQKFQLRSGKLIEVTVRLVPARAFAFTVLTSAGDPIDGAVVFSSTERNRRDSDPFDVRVVAGPAVARTGSNGRCMLEDLGAGLHDVEIFADGYRPLWHVLGTNAQLRFDRNGRPIPRNEPGSHISEIGPDGIVAVLAPIEEPAEVLVTVHAPEGGFLSGARVVCEQHRSKAPRVLETDASGRCRFTGLVEGAYTVELEAQSLVGLVGSNASNGKNRALAEGVELKPDRVAQVELGFLPGSATWIVDVVDPDGTPVPELDVSALGPAFLEAETDAAGRARFDGVPAGEWSLMIFDVWSPSSVVIQTGELRQDRLVRGSSTVRGRVVSASGDKPIRAFVHVSGQVKESAFSGRNGYFEFEHVPPGEYGISASAKNHGTAEMHVEVRSGADLKDIVLRLSPAE